MGLGEVLAAHARGDWSDRTFTCRGCADRYEETANPQGEDERREFMRQYLRLSKPNWTLAEYHDHLTTAVLAWLETLAQDEAVREAVAEDLRNVGHQPPSHAEVAFMDVRHAAIAAVTAFLAAAREA